MASEASWQGGPGKNVPQVKEGSQGGSLQRMQGPLERQTQRASQRHPERELQTQPQAAPDLQTAADPPRTPAAHSLQQPEAPQQRPQGSPNVVSSGTFQVEGKGTYACSSSSKQSLSNTACGSCCAHAHQPVCALHASPAGWVVGVPAQMMPPLDNIPAVAQQIPDRGPGPFSSPMWPQMMMLPPSAAPQGWNPAFVGSPLGGRGPVCVMPGPYALQAAGGGPPAAAAAPQEEAPEGPPKLTASDQRLPHFKAAKGGAAWEIEPPRAAAGRPAAAAAATAEEAQGDDEEDGGFCLPEEPWRARRTADTKSGLLLQGTLRPWTRERRPAESCRARGRALSAHASRKSDGPLGLLLGSLGA